MRNDTRQENDSETMEGRGQWKKCHTSLGLRRLVHGLDQNAGRWWGVVGLVVQRRHRLGSDVPTHLRAMFWDILVEVPQAAGKEQKREIGGVGLAEGTVKSGQGGRRTEGRFLGLREEGGACS